MSPRLLDTDTLIHLVRGEPSITGRYLAALAEGAALCVSAVTVFEFRYGMERSGRHAAQEPAFRQLLTTIEVTPFEADDAERAARLKADLAASGQMIGAYDLLIASQALTRDWAVVTGNLREFSRIPGLTVEDWSSGA